MAKRKEIKFRAKKRGLIHEGRLYGMIFRLINEKPDQSNSYIVTVESTRAKGLGMTTSGHRYFDYFGGVEYCQKIADGEIDPEAELMEFGMEDMEKEERAVREATEKAKKLRDRLEAKGLTYMDLLELEAIHKGLGDIGHNILLGWYHGEGLPHG